MKLPLYSLFFFPISALSLTPACPPSITISVKTVNSRRRSVGSIVCSIYRVNNDPLQMGLDSLGVALLNKE